MKEPLYILDAYGLIYRSYFAFINRPLTNKAGENVSAVYGFFRTLHNFLTEYQPPLFIAAFDSRTPTFRHELYDQYKATRQKTPEDLHAQVPVIEEILTATGIPLVRQDGFEADDIIASVAVRCKAENRPCVIISADKDLMQLVGGPVTVLKPGKTGGWEHIDSAAVFAEWGVQPEGMLDLLSLTGDASDNIPGVKGVGDKTAIKLLQTYGNLEGIYEHADELSGAAGQKIRDGRDMAFFSRKLVALCTEVPLDADLGAYAVQALDKAAGARLLSRHGLPSIAKLYDSAIGEGPTPDQNSSRNPTKAETGASEATAVPKNKRATAAASYSEPPLTAPLPERPPVKSSGTYRAITDPQELSVLVRSALAQGWAAFDCETTGLDVYNDKLCGFSLSLSAGTGAYIPIRGPVPELGEEPPVLMDWTTALAAIMPLLTTPAFTLIVHNGKFDYHILRNHGLQGRITSKIFDTMIAAWLLDPDWSSFSLESLAESQLGLTSIAYGDVVPKGKTFADVPITEAVQYAAEDADLTLRLYQQFSEKLTESGLNRLFEDMEMPLLPVLAEMEIAGIRLEKGALSDFSTELEGKIAATEQEIYDIVGHEFNIASPKQLQQILFVERKLSTGKKTKTGFSTDSSVLEELASEDIVPGKILDYRGLAKLKSTYVDTLPSQADKNDRIHTTFIQSGAATGRLSSRDPNLQNIPIRDDNGRRIRSAFRTAEGFALVSADYAQIELVILAHLSGDKNLGEAFRSGVDVHRRTAALIFGVETEAVTAEMRRIAKTINFGVMYGMSAFRLSNELRIPRGQAAGFINTYFETYSGVADFISETKEKARNCGYVETLMGRRRYIRGLQSSNKNERDGAERIAVNTPIQGSAADIVKAAMLRVDARLQKEKLAARMLLQVHDELILEAPRSETEAVKALLKREMEAVVSLSVPLKVSVESGPSWGEFH